MVGELGDEHLGEEPRARETPLRRTHEPGARRRLHMVLAVPACVLGPQMNVPVEVGRLELQAAGLLMADGGAFLPAARAGPLPSRQVVHGDLGGQLGRNRPAARVSTPLAEWCRRGLLGRRGFDLSREAQKKLGGMDPLALGAKLPAAELDQVVLKLLDAPILLEDYGPQRRGFLGERRDVHRHPQG